MTTKPLVLCTGNSCRSQNTEGILRQAPAGLIEVSNAESTHKFRREVAE